MADQQPVIHGYRHEIDGLRALAVLAVIVNHFTPDALPGGYLGVDLFFVISGYVITGALQSNYHESLLSFLGRFYSRRIKRLLPALIGCVLLTALVLRLIVPHPELSLKTGSAALFGLSNFVLLHDVGYFATSARLNAFTHTWSLGVEEQFYLVYPLAVWAVFRFRSKEGARARLLIVLLGVVFTSLLMALTLREFSPDFVHYTPLTRSWEFGVGCIAYLLRSKAVLLRSNLSRRLSNSALPVIAITFFTPREWAQWGTLVLVLVSGALLTGFQRDSLAYRLCTLRKVRYLGLISYSLYLWHWSVISLSHWTVGVHGRTLIFQAALILGLSAGSYHFVEAPLRRASWSPRAGRVVALGALMSCLSWLLLWGLRSSSADALYTGRAQVALPLPTHVQRACEEQKALPHFLIVGDSHTEAAAALLEPLVTECRVRTSTLRRGLFPTVNSSMHHKEGLSAPPPDTRRKSAYKNAISDLESGDVLVLSSRTLCRLFETCVEPNLEKDELTFFDDRGDIILSNRARALYFDQLKALLRTLGPQGVRVLALLPSPEIETDPRLCDRQWFRPLVSTECFVSTQTRERRTEMVQGYQELQKGAYGEALVLFDPYIALCGEPSCDRIGDEPQLLSDAGHLSPAALSLIAPQMSATVEDQGLLLPPSGK